MDCFIELTTAVKSPSPIEHDRGQLGVCPCGVTKKLLGDLLFELSWAVPNKAFSNEDIIVVRPNKNV
jgi:hypothetical protein